MTVMDAKLFVDYTLFTPIGTMDHVGGPFNTPDEATKFINEVKRAYGPALIKSDVRHGEQNDRKEA